jgi:1-acyl-sn-glycerol-3-phosphate acyltransferase
MQMLGSMLFNVFLYLWMLVFAFTYCVVCPFLSFKNRFRLAGVMTYVVFFAARVLCGIRFTVEGRENLPEGNHVIFMKHSSTWETFGIMILFPPLVWVMKREILWIPFVGWGCVLAS